MGQRKEEGKKWGGDKNIRQMGGEKDNVGNTGIVRKEGRQKSADWRKQKGGREKLSEAINTVTCRTRKRHLVLFSK